MWLFCFHLLWGSTYTKDWGSVTYVIFICLQMLIRHVMFILINHLENGHTRFHFVIMKHTRKNHVFGRVYCLTYRDIL